MDPTDLSWLAQLFGVSPAGAGEIGGLGGGVPTGAPTPMLNPTPPTPLSQAPPGSVPNMGLGEQGIQPPRPPVLPTPPITEAPGAGAPGWVGSTLFPWIGAGSTPAAVPPTPLPSGTPPAPTAPAGPLDIRPPAQQAGPVPGGGGASADRLLQTLRGVQAPAPPQAQKVSTPHAPQQGRIQGNQLVNLMASLGVGPRDVFQIPRLTMGGR